MGYPPSTAGQNPPDVFSAAQQAQKTAEQFFHGLDLHQKGQLAEARASYEQVLAREPKHFDALHLLGVIACQSGNPQLAVDLFGKAIEINRRSAAAYSNYGNALQELKRWDEALTSYDRAIELNPHDPDLFYNRGNALQELKRLDEAVTSYAKATAISPNFAAAFNNCGNALREMKRWDQALVSYNKAIAISPDYADALYNRGNVLKDLGCLDEALASYDKAIANHVGFSKALTNRGNALQALKRWDEALASYEKAIAINAADVEASTNRGNALQALGRLEEALACYDHAIAINPEYADAFSNRGSALQELKRVDEALASYGKAIAIQPDYAEANWNRSLCHLLNGDFEAGWPNYEWRWSPEICTEQARQYSQPLWLGASSLLGKTILLYAEQGFGDALQFSRYVRQVASLGATVVLEAPSPLIPLFVDLEGVSVLVVKGSELPAFDCHCPLMSLPLAFKTRLSDVEGSPYLRVPGDRLAAWSSRIGARSAIRVGLVWNGSTAHKNDAKRSIRWNEFKHLLIDGPDYFCLQKDLHEDDQRELNSSTRVRTFTSDLIDFSDTAALISLMDVVITVDTSVAHLAGALGKNVWVLLPHVPDWRWLLERSDSPWYDSATLFRQPRRGDWASVVDNVVCSLQERLAVEAMKSATNGS